MLIANGITVEIQFLRPAKLHVALVESARVRGSNQYGDEAAMAG